MERRDWTTRPWANRDANAPAETARDIDVEMPYLWFLASDGAGSAFQPWATGPNTVFVPCFLDRDEATALAYAAGVEPTFVLGFPLYAVPDLMADLSHPVFVVTGVSATRRIEGHYLPAPAVTPDGAIHAA